MEQNQKQYGLVKLSKGASSNPAPSRLLVNKPSIFGESDDDSDADSGSVPQFSSSGNARKQAKAKISEAVELDPSIFQYDEVYDVMKSNADNAKPKATIEKKSRYISNMLKNKDKREKEQELRSERKIQKERELEGDEFKDKEAFVTSAYKEKLEEMRKAQEDIDREQNIENMLDVTKQGDLTGFYRSFYRNNLFSANETVEAVNETNEAVKFNKKSANQRKSNLRERNMADEDEEEKNEENASQNDVAPEIEKPEAATIHITETEKSKDLSTRIESNTGEAKKRPSEEAKPKDNLEKTDTEPTSAPTEEDVEDVLPVKKPKIDRTELIKQMFTKRTVGAVFEEARIRYLERKALREICIV